MNQFSKRKNDMNQLCDIKEQGFRGEDGYVI